MITLKAYVVYMKLFVNFQRKKHCITDRLNFKTISISGNTNVNL